MDRPTATAPIGGSGGAHELLAKPTEDEQRLRDGTECLDAIREVATKAKFKVGKHASNH